jgi:hypothetical protein
MGLASVQHDFSIEPGHGGGREGVDGFQSTVRQLLVEIAGKNTGRVKRVEAFDGPAPEDLQRPAAADSAAFPKLIAAAEIRMTETRSAVAQDGVSPAPAEPAQKIGATTSGTSQQPLAGERTPGAPTAGGRASGTFNERLAQIQSMRRLRSLQRMSGLIDAQLRGAARGNPPAGASPLASPAGEEPQAKLAPSGPSRIRSWLEWLGARGIPSRRARA